MKKILLTLLLLPLFHTTAAHAQSWSAGAGAGPFVFDKLIERRFRIGNETGSGEITSSLSAKTRVGGTVDLERDFNGWLGVRLQGAYTQSKLAVKSSGGPDLDAGSLDVTTITLPVVVNFSRHGAFRLHVMAGPAYVSYDLNGDPQANSALATFDGSRNRWGGMAGAGIDWWLNDDLALEGEIADVATASPFERSDFPSTTNGLSLKRTNNVHTTVGIRYRF